MPVAYGSLQSAAAAVREQFEALKRITDIHRKSQDRAVAGAAFDAEQNARVVLNPEEYYREMYNFWVNTWNLRDRHMADILDALAEHLRQRDGYARIVVWAHNSHLGDARATESALRGEWNLGSLRGSDTRARSYSSAKPLTQVRSWRLPTGVSLAS